MADQKKESFLDRLKKTRPDSGGSFASRFSGGDQATEEEDDDGDSGATFAKRFSKKEKPKSFQEEKGVKRSKKDADGFAEDVRKKRSDCVYLVRGKDRGKAAWHYVLVDKGKKQMFLAAAKSGSLDVADYGEVLYSGWGQDPPADIKKKIDDQYN